MASLAGAGLALVLARLNEPNRTLWHATALGLGAFGAWKLGTAGFEGFADALTGLPARLFARIRGETPPETSAPVPANPGVPNPGATFNGPAAIGRFLDPIDGGELDLSPLVTSYRVRLDVQNTGDASLEGPPELSIHETPLFGAGSSWTQLGPRFRLAPGERRVVELNVETRARFSPSVVVDATLRWGGHWITSASWTLE